jgi:hypothetical protein
MRKATAEDYEWMEKFAADVSMSYDELIEAAKLFLEDDNNYLIDGGRFENARSYTEEFWEKFELCTGILVAENERSGLFSCSC